MLKNDYWLCLHVSKSVENYVHKMYNAYRILCTKFVHFIYIMAAGVIAPLFSKILYRNSFARKNRIGFNYVAVSPYSIHSNKSISDTVPHHA
jgi:hypothetical protein